MTWIVHKRIAGELRDVGSGGSLSGSCGLYYAPTRCGIYVSLTDAPLAAALAETLSADNARKCKRCWPKRSPAAGVDQVLEQLPDVAGVGAELEHQVEQLPDVAGVGAETE